MQILGFPQGTSSFEFYYIKTRLIKITLRKLLLTFNMCDTRSPLILCICIFFEFSCCLIVDMYVFHWGFVCNKILEIYYYSYFLFPEYNLKHFQLGQGLFGGIIWFDRWNKVQGKNFKTVYGLANRTETIAGIYKNVSPWFKSVCFQFIKY